MEISEKALLAQADLARKLWGPTIELVSTQYKLSKFLLYAVGSRETNLQPQFTEGATGDGGHGHGVFQLDDRWHVIPAGFDHSFGMQVTTAARMLADLIRRENGDLRPALNRYNSGQTTNAGTTGGNYGPEVIERLHFLDTSWGGKPPVTSPIWPGRYLRIQNPYLTGADVITWQKQMKIRGWTIDVDSFYGPQSESVCKKFQSEKHLPVDGVVGPITWLSSFTAKVT